MVTASGNSFVDTHANKGSRRCRYYVEQHHDTDRPSVRLPAKDIESAVTHTVVEFLRDTGALLAGLRNLDRADVKTAAERGAALASQVADAGPAGRAVLLRPLLLKVGYGEGALKIELSGSGLHGALRVGQTSHEAGNNYRTEDAKNIAFGTPLTERRRGRQLKLVLGNETIAPTLDPTLVTAIARVHCWTQSLVTGTVKSITEIAKLERVSLTYVAQLLPLGFMAPSLVTEILAGRQPATLTADRVIRRERVSERWTDQLRKITELTDEGRLSSLRRLNT